MWTPKRILILFGGICFFVTLFTIYSYVFPEDGLPNLPPELGPTATPLPARTETTNPGDQKLLEAFGADCEELRRDIRLFLRSKGLAVSAQEFVIEPDGRVKLAPFSACLFPKGRPDGKYAEINTVKCDVAFLTLDQPVKNVTELSSRKIVGIELRSRQNAADQATSNGPQGILITNNRRSPQKSDDLEVRITNAPLFYDDVRNLIWTDGFVQLLDIQTQPHPTRITARGMEIQLARDNAATRTKTAKAPGKAKGDAVGGVESLLLRSNVDMYLYVDPRSGFLADPQDFSGKNASRPVVAAGEVQEKSKVVITTNGQFFYDLTKELAQFDSPPPRPQGAPLENEHVLVTREHKLPGKATQQDQLWCHRLELQFHRKAEGPREHKTTNKEIETALATTRPGKQVKLDMRTENMEAFGLELIYRCPTPTAGPQTILKGQPMYAVKDGHKIEARELHLMGADKNGQGQKALARGPGQIDLFDKANVNKPYPLHAVWRDTLVSTKVREDGKLLDLLTLTGDASFIDEERRQELNGQKLQVWLEAGGTSPVTPNANAPTNAAPSRQRPHRLEAFEKVSAFGQDMIVRHANHLVVRFKDDVTPEYTLPEALPVTNKGLGPTASPTGMDAPPATAQVQAKSSPVKPGPVQETAKPRKPIELQANEVTAYINRAGNRNQLQELVSEGNVHVTQEGQSPKDKGVDIEGEMLNLIHHPSGDILYVFGDSRKKARLQMGEIILSGPKVTINQKDNVAEVDGTGVMDLPSNTNLDGGKASKPGSRLVVHWNKEMIFNGKFANFQGGVQAFQDNGSLKCQTLDVTLDREVSFKEGQRGGQTARVEKMVCDLKVLAVDEIKDDKGVLTSYRRGEFVQLTVDNQEGPTIGTGPGSIRFWGRSGGDIVIGAAPATNVARPSDKKTDELMKVTQINFEGRMFSNNKDNTRTSKFYDNVEVHQFPAASPTAALDPNALPKGAFQLKCDRLSVYTKQLAGKSSQLMWAEGKVVFRTDEFFGRADIVKFDEAADHVIFEAAQGNTVTITKSAAPGVQNQVIRGTKILYKRQTGEFILDGVRSIQSRLDSNEQEPAVQASHSDEHRGGPAQA